MLEIDCQNPNIFQFALAARKLKENPSLELSISIITDKNVDKRTYNKPTSKEIAILIPSLSENNEPTNREGIIFENMEKYATLMLIRPHMTPFNMF